MQHQLPGIAFSPAKRQAALSAPRSSTSLRWPQQQVWSPGVQVGFARRPVTWQSWIAFGIVFSDPPLIARRPCRGHATRSAVEMKPQLLKSFENSFEVRTRCRCFAGIRIARIPEDLAFPSPTPHSGDHSAPWRRQLPLGPAPAATLRSGRLVNVIPTATPHTGTLPGPWRYEKALERRFHSI